MNDLLYFISVEWYYLFMSSCRLFAVSFVPLEHSWVETHLTKKDTGAE